MKTLKQIKKRKAYKKKWGKEHPESVRASNKKYDKTRRRLCDNCKKAIKKLSPVII